MKLGKLALIISLWLGTAGLAWAPEAGAKNKASEPSLAGIKAILEDSSGRYGLICTRRQVAEELTRALAEREPKNAEAWRLWADLLEKQAECAGVPVAWAEDNGFSESAQGILLGAGLRSQDLLREAQEKYRRAADLAPGDFSIWAAWGGNLFTLAGLEIEPETRRRLVTDASDKYEQAVALRADDPALRRDWALALMAMVKTESETELWSSWLDQAQAEMNHSLKLTPVVSDQVLELWSRAWREAWPKNNENRAKLYKISQIMVDKCRQMTVLSPEAESSWMALGQALLENSLLETNSTRAQALRAEARAAFDQAGALAFEATHFRFDRGRIYLAVARELAEGPQRESLIGEALAIVDKRPLESAATVRPLVSTRLEEARLIMVAGALAGERFRRRELVGRADLIFQDILLQSPNNQEVLTAWAQALLDLATQETDPQVKRKLKRDAEEKWRLVVEATLDKKTAWLDWGRSLVQQARQGDDLGWRCGLLKDAFDKFDQAARSEPDYLPIWAEWGRGLLLLADLEPDVDNTWAALEAAAGKFERAANLEQAELFVTTREDDSTYQLAQLYIRLAEGHEADRFIFNSAMIAYKQAFNLQLRDLDQSLLIWTLQEVPANAKSHPAETRQEALAFRIDYFFQAMPWAYNFADLDPWQLTQVAGLYRQAAAAALVPPELRKIYWQQAEQLFKQALAAYQEFEAPPANEAERYDRSLALSELGLVIAEQSMLEPARGRPPLIEEARKLWLDAENIRPGSSRYAQSRWAAWEGDWDACRQHMRHNLFQARQRLFPSFEEARLDPAYAEVKDEPWFSRVWLGLER